MTCLINSQIDGFINDHIIVRGLKTDTALKGIKIREMSEIITDQDERTKILNIENSDNSSLVVSWKKDYFDMQNKYKTKYGQASRRGKACIVLTGIIGLLVAIVVLKAN